ncbi:MAG: hypothetical protein ACR2G3_09840, partial [Solirubrobacterales bacterium]
MRRPDLPLMLLVLAMGAGLIALAGDGRSSPPVGATLGAPPSAPDPIDDFFADFDPVFIDCFGGLDPIDGEDVDPADQAALVDQVSTRVERLRDLRFERAVEARFLAPAALRDEVEGLVAEELPPAEIAREEQVLRELGAIPPAGDLEEITTEALGSQVAGLYDTKSGELLVGRSEDVGADELITLAHELEHALSDQALGIRERSGGPRAVDRELAYSAVVEGDATLLMELYALSYVGFDEQLELGESVPGEEEFAALPDYVQRSLLFPYLEGLRLVCHRFTDGGWRAVNELYEDPPAATSQVIFPDRYGVIEPRSVSLPPRPGPGWRSISRRELGAAELEWLFRAPGGDPEASLPEPRELVFGWAGGELELWRRGGELALAISLAELPKTESLCGAVGAWYRGERAEGGGGGGEGAPVGMEVSPPG